MGLELGQVDDLIGLPVCPGQGDAPKGPASRQIDRGMEFDQLGAALCRCPGNAAPVGNPLKSSDAGTVANQYTSACFPDQFGNNPNHGRVGGHGLFG